MALSERDRELLALEASRQGGGLDMAGQVDVLAAIGGAMPPPMPPPAPPQAAPAQPLPPPIAIPERMDPHAAGAPAGRRAHKAISGLLAPFTGQNSYRDRFATEEAMANADYRRQIADYQMRVADRQRQIDEQQGMQPIPETLAAAYGLPAGTTARQVQTLYQPMGYGSLIRGREGQGASMAMQDARQQGAEDLQTLRHENRMEEIAASGRRRSSGGGGGGRVALDQVEAMPDFVREALEAEAAGQSHPDKRRAEEWYARTYGGKDWESRWDRSVSQISADVRRREGDQKELRKYAASSAGTRAGVRDWNSFLAENRDDIGQWFEEIRSDQQGLKSNNLSDGAKMLRDRLRGVLARYLPEQGGAALSQSEAQLYGGVAGGLLIDKGSEGGIISLDGLVGRLSDRIATGNMTFGEIQETIRQIAGAQREQMRAATAGMDPRTVASVLGPDESRQYAMDRLRRAPPKPPADGAKIAPSSVQMGPDGAVTFRWVMPDGTTQEGSL